MKSANSDPNMNFRFRKSGFHIGLENLGRGGLDWFPDNIQLKHKTYPIGKKQRREEKYPKSTSIYIERISGENE